MNNKGFIASIPYIALVIGIGLFCYGTFATFENAVNKEFFSGLGKTILASGIFALLLKTIQFMGVFKDELSKVIYDPKFLANRKDLQEIWEGVSRELFKNKFSGISKRLLKDITEKYFPTDHSTYYDDVEHYMTIKHLSDGRVELTYKVELNVVCSNTESCEYEFSNTLSFKDSPDDISLEYTVKVDGTIITCTPTELTENNTITYTNIVPLSGKDKYKIERREIKKYSLDNDNIMYFRAAKLLNNLKLDIQHPEDLIVDFRKCGTISDFDIKTNTDNHKQLKYNGILYPQQGYIFTLNKKTA